MIVFEVQAKTQLGKWISILRYGYAPGPANPCASYRSTPTVQSNAARHDVKSIAAQYEAVGSAQIGKFVDVYC